MKRKPNSPLKKAKMFIPTEEEDCIALVNYLEELKDWGQIKLFTHIPNSTFTKLWSVKVKNKRMGVRAGFPDYFILTNKKPIIIEMKRIVGGIVSNEQNEWISELNNTGILTRVCYGLDEAMQFINENI